MKFGVRLPSVKRRIAARTSPARFFRNNLGLKAPWGWGWLTNPRKALYNRVYNRTTVSVDDLARGCGRRKGFLGCLSILGLLLGALSLGVLLVH